MKESFGYRLTSEPLPRLRFFVLFALVFVVFAAASALLGLNFGLKNVLLIFVPVAVVFLLISFSLVARRYNDAGLPGTVVGAAAFLAMSILFGMGMYGIGLVTLALLFLVACALPSKTEALTDTV